MKTQADIPVHPEKKKQPQPEQENLKGTLVAVLIVGGIILFSWFGVFGLFLERA